MRSLDPGGTGLWSLYWEHTKGQHMGNVYFRVQLLKWGEGGIHEEKKRDKGWKRMEPDPLGSVSACEGKMGSMDSELLGE